MKKLVPFLFILLLIALIVIGVLYLIGRNTATSNNKKTTSVIFINTRIPFGFSQSPIFGNPSFTGVLSKYTKVSSTWIALQFQGSDVAFGFDPRKTFATNYSDPKQTKTLWNIPTLDQFENLLKKSSALTLIFKNLSLDTNISTSDLPSQVKTSSFSIIFYTY